MRILVLGALTWLGVLWLFMRFPAPEPPPTAEERWLEALRQRDPSAHARALKAAGRGVR